MAGLDPAAPVVLELPGMAEVTVRAGLPYLRAGDRTLAMDLYLPAGPAPAAGWPVVVLVHGDTDPALLRGVRGWGQYTGWGRLLGASGLAGVVFEHRSLREAPVAAVAGEVDAALARVRERAGDLGVDPGRLGVVGFSAGVPQAMRAAATAAVRCVACCYGPLDLEGFGGLPAAAAAELSALARLRGGAGFPPLLLVRAGRDDPDLNGSIDAFAAEALARNLDLELVNHPDGRHGFDTLDATEASRRVLRRLLAFLAERLAG
jgi:dienelactone hydrolase